MKLVIDRKKWLVGERRDSYLRRKSDGKMCCLGFLAKTCGIRNIVEKREPHEIKSSKWPKGILDEYKETSAIAHCLMEVNDSDSLPHEERESRIKKLMKQLDIDVEFVNHY